jgi:hypothetical protein
MTEVPISKIQLNAARIKAEQMGTLKNSITRGEANLEGFLGEILVAKHIKAQVKNTYNYDLIKDGRKIDVKTKRCTSEPRADYECSIAAYNTKQKCDYYIFVRILEDHSRGWILGMIKKDEYFKRARFCKEGETDPKSHLGWKFKADCYNLEIKELYECKQVETNRNSA